MVATDLGIRGLAEAVEIGHGGFATVYRAKQPSLDRFVAVKVFGDLAVDATTLADFERECRAIGRLSGRQNIVPVYEAGITDSGHPYMVMAYLPAGSLQRRLEREGRLAWQEVANWGVKLARALDVAHQSSVLHRDVKPDNILLSLDGEPELADFGIARLTDSTRVAATGLAFTPAHVAPEVLAGAPATPLVDVYSLSSTLFTLLAGRPAFVEHPDDNFFLVLNRVHSAPLPDLLRPLGVPDRLCRVVEAAMAKDPGARPPSAAAFAEAIARAIVPTPSPWPPPIPPVTAPPPPPPSTPPPPPLPSNALPHRPVTVATPARRSKWTPLFAIMIAIGAILLTSDFIDIVSPNKSSHYSQTFTIVSESTIGTVGGLLLLFGAAFFVRARRRRG